MSKLRILVVEDSITIRRRLCEVLSADPGLEVVGEAEDGKRAIELCETLRPDVITLDIVMPVMSGLSATEHIMAYRPTPILIVSASMNRGELFATYDALAAGAVDVLEKPAPDEPDASWAARFIAAVKLISRIKVITHPRARLGGRDKNFIPSERSSSNEPRQPARPSGRALSVLALGASTGGPAAIVRVLQSLPPGLAVPILFVLHIDEPFGAAFAEWLDRQTGYRVAYARDREPLESLGGQVVMAPPGRHLILEAGRLRLSADPPRHSCRPSVDVMFESLAVERGDQVLACLLTGMGRDGASGLLAIRQAGGFTIAQDESSSIVYGMPREAALLGAAQMVLPLDQIAPQIAQRLGVGERRAT